MKHLITHLAVVLAISSAGAFADDIIRQNFDATTSDALPEGASPVGRVWAWTGPSQNEFGQAVVQGDRTPEGSGKAIVLTNAAHTNTSAPVIAIDWRDTPAADSTKPISVSYKFMVPLAGPYLSAHFFGTDWSGSAIILGIEEGRITAIYKDGKRLEIGKYEVGKWVSIKAIIDGEKKTVSLWLNDKKIANALPWHDEVVAVNVINITASNKPIATDGTKVIYVDDIVVETVEPVAK